MNKKSFLTALLLLAAAGFLAAQTQTLSILATITDGTVTYYNNCEATWIDGTITVTRSSTANNPYFTVDMVPQSDDEATGCPRNVNWVYYDTFGGSDNFDLDAAEVYASSKHSTSGNILKMWDVTGVGDDHVSSNNVFSGHFIGSNLTRTFNFAAVVWHNSRLGAGSYELPITFRLRQEAFSASGPATNPIASTTQALRFVVGTAATIAFISGNSEFFDLAFDEITAMAPKDFTIRVQTNFRFYLNVKSKNLGYLNHADYPNEKIGYSLSIDNTTIPLSAGTYKFITQQSATYFGTSAKDYDATITIGDITNYTAGRYEDVLSFTITSY